MFVCLLTVLGCCVNEFLNDVVWMLLFVLLCGVCPCDVERVCVLCLRVIVWCCMICCFVCGALCDVA